MYECYKENEEILALLLSLNNILFGNMVISHTLYMHNYRIGKQVNNLY